jgi:hypothetical protein
MELKSSPSGTGSCSSKVTSKGGGPSGVLAASSLTSRVGAGIFFMVRGSNDCGSGSWRVWDALAYPQSEGRLVFLLGLWPLLGVPKPSSLLL